jgi:hypothetical protein
MQVSAYAMAYMEMTGQAVDEAWIVRFDKTRKKFPQIRIVKNLKETFDAFLGAKKLWSFLNEK